MSSLSDLNIEYCLNSIPKKCQWHWDNHVFNCSKPSRVQLEPAEPAYRLQQPTTLDLEIEAHRGLLPVYELNWTELNWTVKVPIVLGGNWPWPSRSNLTSKSEFTQFWACPDHNSLPIQARITKFGPEVENSLVKVPIVLGGSWPRPSRSNLI